jgi:hypothetical protein
LLLLSRGCFWILEGGSEEIEGRMGSFQGINIPEKVYRKLQRIYTKNVNRKTVRKAVKNATEKRKPLYEATIFGFQPAPPWGRKKTRPE